MLYTKFNGYRMAKSVKKIFKGFLPYMDMVAVLVIWPGQFEQMFFLPIHKIKALYEICL